jgi:hypothetical protein
VADSDSVKGIWDYKYSVDNPCASCVKRVPRYTDVGLENAGFAQGVRIGNAQTGAVTAYIPPHTGPDGPIDLTERLAADSKGNVYLAQARTLHLRKYVRRASGL